VKLGTRLFILVFSFYFGLTALGGFAIYFIAYSINLGQVKAYLSTNVQYNAESTDKSLLRVYELLIYPAYLPTLYDKALATDPTSLSEARRIILRRDLETLFALNTYVPLRTYFPTSNYLFAIDSNAPTAVLFESDSGSPIRTTDQVEDEPWFPKDDEITVTPDSARQVIVFSRRVHILEGGVRHFAGVLAIEISQGDLTLAQDAHPVSSANLFFLKTTDGDLLRITPDTDDFSAALFDGIVYHNDRSPASDVWSGGVRYLMQPFRLNSGWELICLVPYRVINASLTPLLILILSVDLITLLLLLYFSRFYIPRLISAPISRLSHGIGEVMRHDDYSRSLPVEDSFTELSVLYDAYNRLMKHITQLIARIYDENEKSREAEVLALQAQINPHFLYNTLDSIGWTLNRDDARVSTILSSLSTILRYSISDPNRLVRLSEEVDVVRDYIAIQEFCYSLSFHLEVEGSMMEGFYLPKLTLQPLVENSILHGIREVEGLEPRIRISAVMQESFLEVAVENNGKSPDLDVINRLLEEGTGIRKHGLANVNRRLRLRFGEESGLRFEIPEGGGLIVRFRIPA
jgi:sensor histidine kinase YesM